MFKTVVLFLLPKSKLQRWLEFVSAEGPPQQILGSGWQQLELFSVAFDARSTVCNYRKGETGQNLASDTQGINDTSCSSENNMISKT